MREFSLQIFTPDGVAYDDMAESIVVRTTEGDVCILYGHADYVTTIDYGKVKIRKDGSDRYAACMGGLLSVSNNVARITATTFEYAEAIDEDRATLAKERAEEVLSKSSDNKQVQIAEIKLKRALTRLEVAKYT